ncbi:MAG: hypothetical protein EOP86_17500 [Verrucomicrobiaceae bacterium]|nr:MAG: hypothetical protein EOP86_17500 [Verrucomicrobiaceae bacterium]
MQRADAAPEWKTEYQFPLPPRITEILEGTQDPFGEFSGMSSIEAKTALLKKFVFPGHPHLGQFAQELLRDAGLPFLTFLPEPAYGTGSYLSFRNGEIEFHLAGWQQSDDEFQALYPFRRVPGLLEFFENFGGMVPSGLLPAPVFQTCREKLILNPMDPKMEWGNIGPWVNSLAWYVGPGGDMIIFHPDGTPGVWCHEGSDEQRTWPIELSFPQLLVELRKFIFKEGTKEEQQENAFYY